MEAVSFSHFADEQVIHYASFIFEQVVASCLGDRPHTKKSSCSSFPLWVNKLLKIYPRRRTEKEILIYL